MKKTVLLAFCLFSITIAWAQREFWGLSAGYGTTPSFGSIYKTDINGQNLQIVHLFDEIQGKDPKARLFLASNGKLYGTANKGGSFFNEANEGGVLFEYDLITDRYRVVANFGGNGLTREPFTDVIEPVPGVLFGASLHRIFRYDIATETTTVSVTMPQYNNGNFDLSNNVNDLFMKASDGFVYGVTTGAAGCIGSSSQAAGTIIRLNPENNTFTQPYIFPCYPNDSGYYPIGSLVEGLPGKLYGTTEVGGINNDGVLFEYDMVTHAYTKKFDFNELISGKSPVNLVNGNNGKLYGITTHGGTNPCNANQHIGTLFEYNIANNTVTTLAHMGCDAQSGFTRWPNGTLLKASNGNIFGVSAEGIFKFDISTNILTDACPACRSDPDYRNGPAGGSNGLIEICRKPSYRHFEVSDFTVCAGSPFTFDLHNDNAVSYIWKKSGVTLPSQTTGILNFDNITISDGGVYTCEMVNECGSTIVPAITVTVNPSNTSTITSIIPVTADTIMICPGTNAMLSGNDNGGRWSTGETTSAIIVSQPGNYQIVNTNACGNTYSNSVTVGLYELPQPITIYYNSILCLGAPVTLTGNVMGGVWKDGSTGSSLTVPLELNREYYVTLQHPCGTITSNILEFHESDLYDDPVPEIIPAGPLNICGGNAVVLNSNYPGSGANNFWAWYRTDPITLINYGASVTITQPGTYFIERTSYCFGRVLSEPITITESNEPPATPIITVNGEVTDFVTLCNQESITLTSSAETGNLWNTGETTQFIEVSESGSFGVTVSNGCGESTSNFVSTYSLLPDVTINITENNTLTVNEANATYQWLQCSIAAIPPVEIAGATSQNFTPTEDGLYAVRVTNQQGCTATSQCFRFGTMGVPHDISKNNIVLFPNPAKEKVTLQTSAIVEKITMVNMLGQTVLLSLNTKEADTSSLPQGQYILIAQTENGVWRGKFIKG